MTDLGASVTLRNGKLDVTTVWAPVKNVRNAIIWSENMVLKFLVSIWKDVGPDWSRGREKLNIITYCGFGLVRELC